ncbi:MAG TPA: hypothetical protein VK732_01175 [Verrucomicrobiae bacterium]|nr:hypothetical protein [Verrucomicrobiae bacterium]
MPYAAQAVHDTGIFQLDGDAQTSTNTAGTPAALDDWDKVCNQVTGGGLAGCGTTAVTSGATAVSWTAEPNPNSSIFTGGGSKDPIDINQWAWKDGAGGLPDKDNLEHGFAARYSAPPSTNCPSGGNPTCELIYFGSDRFDNSGDAQQGFWFFQNRITLGSNKVGGASGFNGIHMNGDVLVISDFSIGGTISTITVYTWDSSCLAAGKPSYCGDTNLHLQETSDAANCVTAGPDDAFCGLVNPKDGVVAPWPFLDKSSNSTYLQGEFLEAGINLSLLPNIANECFASFLAETRSSQSTTATLKDFVLGNFGNCVATMSTQVSSAGPVTPGTAVHDTATVVGNQPSKTPSGTVTFFLCGPIATGACDGTTNVGTKIGTGTLSGSGGTASADSPDVNTGIGLDPGRYCFRAEWPGDANYTTPLIEYGGANGTNECFTVQQVPSSTTSAQTWLPNDSATVTSTLPLSGSLSFTLHDGGDCTGTILRPAETYTFSGATSPLTRSTTNSTVSVTASSTVSWEVVFTSTDKRVTGSSRCESSVVTITN